MKVCLDAGHGGRDSGALASPDAFPDLPRAMEKDYTLAQTLVAGSFLVAAGFEVVFTRETDVFVELGARARISNDAGAHAFVSIHFNAATATADGTILMHHARSPDGRRLAEELFERVAPIDLERGERNERIWAVPDGVDGSRWETSVPTVIGRTRAPAVIVETEFGSNPEEARRIFSTPYQIAVGQAIAEALLAYRDAT